MEHREISVLPTTIATILVFAIGLLPGFFADYFYNLVSGSDWRDKDWQSGLRLIGLSAIGLFLYVMFAAFVDGIPALHVIPGSFDPEALSAVGLPRILVPFVGHSLFAAGAGFVGAHLHRWISRRFGASGQPSTWNHFITEEVGERWVVVTLHSGEVYAGMLLIAEQGVAQSERDLVLRSPALWSVDGSNYQVLPYRDLFLPSALVQNIGTLRLAKDADLPTQVGTHLFREENDDRAQTGEPAAPAPPGETGRGSEGRIHAPLAEGTAVGSASAAPIDTDKEVTPA